MADGQQPAAPAASEGTVQTPPEPTPPAKAPQWDGEFDPERAAKLIANLRSEAEAARNELKQARTVLEAQEEAEKSDLQKAQEARERAARELEETRTELLRLRTQKEHGLPDELATFLTGDEETMKVQAERLAAFAKAPADELPHRPEAALTPGHGGPAPEPKFDADAAAAAIRAEQ
jgi:septal ring factor EnvC (AmiA/AmiB activator)